VDFEFGRNLPEPGVPRPTASGDRIGAAAYR